MMSSLVAVCNISANLPDGALLFHDFSFSLLKGEKVGLVGKNGVGKSTLLRILKGELKPKKGQIITKGKISYLPQKVEDFWSCNLAEILSVQDKMNALVRAEQGRASVEDIHAIGDDWDLENQIKITLQNLNLEYLNLTRIGSTLSGGELMRSLFARVLLEKPDLILMDEPTNNLDLDSKSQFVKALETSKLGMIIVSHDRELLNKMDRILEISNLGLKSFGGNFDFYIEQRNIEDAAAQDKLINCKEVLKLQIENAQKTKEKQEKRNIRGEKSASKIGVSRLLLGSMIRKAQNTTARLKEVHEYSVKEAQEKLDDAKENIRSSFSIHIDIEKSKIPQTKEMIICKNLNFKYKYDQNLLWTPNLNIEIIGNKRVAILGKNGSGKSTFIKLITGNLTPSQGEIKLGSQHFFVLDQHCSLLKDELSILENMQIFASDKIENHELRIRAGRFLFYGDSVFKKVKVLSGGERLRVALACLLATNNAPDILILDEPTNNLDLESIDILKNSLNKYSGTLIVISHDQYFLNDITIEKMIYLERSTNAL